MNGLVPTARELAAPASRASVAWRVVKQHEQTRGLPGRAEGLSDREAEILALITQGKNNAEIAALTYLSPNTVKSYVRKLTRVPVAALEASGARTRRAPPPQCHAGRSRWTRS